MLYFLSGPYVHTKPYTSCMHKCTDIPPQHKHQTQIPTDTYISMYTHIKFEKESEYIFLAATTEAFYVYMHTYMLQAYTHSNTHMYT